MPIGPQPGAAPSGFEVSVLSPSDEAFYTGIHAANHAFHRLRWLYDLNTIARVLRPEERTQVRELAVAKGQSGHFVGGHDRSPGVLSVKLLPWAAMICLPWTRLTPRQTRRMVERVEGNTGSLG